MTSHVRHRRTDIATDPPPVPLEPGELAVNTANRQIAAGSPGGTPIALIAVRYFDERAQYVENDFVAREGVLWIARGDVPPGPFVEAQWKKASTDEQDPTDLSAYLLKTGGTMSGPLLLYGDPSDDREAATKKYVDDSTPPPPAASEIAITPVGDIQATDTQAAIAELDAEKVAKAGDVMTGTLSLPIDLPPTQPEHATHKQYVDDQIGQGLALKVDRAGDTMNGALVVRANVTAGRTPTTGTLFLGTDGLHYLDFDGTKYTLPAGGLDIGGLLTSSGATLNGTLTANQAANLNGATTLHSDGYFGAGAPSKLQIYGDSSYPTIAFHAPGYFGANFGMNTDGNFYIGGWSYGAGNYYKVLTTRESYVQSHRMVYIADYFHIWNQWLVEPYSGCSITGFGGYVSADGWNVGDLARYRQHQILVNGGWYAVGYA